MNTTDKIMAMADEYANVLSSPTASNNARQALRAEIEALVRERDELLVLLAAASEKRQDAQAVSLVTEQMIAAGQHAWMTADGVDPVRVFNAMLNAAHTLPVQEKQS